MNLMHVMHFENAEKINQWEACHNCNVFRRILQDAETPNAIKKLNATIRFLEIIPGG